MVGVLWELPALACAWHRMGVASGDMWWGYSESCWQWHVVGGVGVAGHSMWWRQSGNLQQWHVVG